MSRATLSESMSDQLFPSSVTSQSSNGGGTARPSPSALRSSPSNPLVSSHNSRLHEKLSSSAFLSARASSYAKPTAIRPVAVTTARSTGGALADRPAPSAARPPPPPSNTVSVSLITGAHAILAPPLSRVHHVAKFVSSQLPSLALSSLRLSKPRTIAAVRRNKALDKFNKKQAKRKSQGPAAAASGGGDGDSDANAANPDAAMQALQWKLEDTSNSRTFSGTLERSTVTTLTGTKNDSSYVLLYSTGIDKPFTAYPVDFINFSEDIGYATLSLEEAEERMKTRGKRFEKLLDASPTLKRMEREKISDEQLEERGLEADKAEALGDRASASSAGGVAVKRKKAVGVENGNDDDDDDGAVGSKDHDDDLDDDPDHTRLRTSSRSNRNKESAADFNEEFDDDDETHEFQPGAHEVDDAEDDVDKHIEVDETAEAEQLISEAAKKTQELLEKADRNEQEEEEKEEKEKKSKKGKDSESKSDDDKSDDEDTVDVDDSESSEDEDLDDDIEDMSDIDDIEEIIGVSPPAVTGTKRQRDDDSAPTTTAATTDEVTKRQRVAESATAAEALPNVMEADVRAEFAVTPRLTVQELTKRLTSKRRTEKSALLTILKRICDMDPKDRTLYLKKAAA